MERFEHGGDIYANQNVMLDFSVNINPFGMPVSIKQALISRVNEFTQYPDPQCRDLCDAISHHEKVPTDWILCGNGAADLIYRLCYAIKPRKALICVPTFSEYERALMQVTCHVIYHTLTAKNYFAVTPDINKIITPDIDVLFLCNPNNPTGCLIHKEILERILKQAKRNHITVIIDECFLNFTDSRVSCKEYLEVIPRLVVLKAFTKMYAMAGLRLGYLLTADSKLLNKVNDAAQCWSVSVPAQIAGITALSCAEWEEKTRRLIVKEREFLLDSLCELGITVFPSNANYILLRSERPLYELLLEKGILIRACENFKGLDSTYYRIGIKKRDDNICLIQALKEIFNG